MDKHYLNEQEVEKVIAFNEDPIMKQAVKKVILEGIFSIGVLEAGRDADNRNWAYNLAGLNDMAMSNEVVGGLLKATAKGFGALEDGFKRIEEFKRKAKEDNEDKNPAV